MPDMRMRYSMQMMADAHTAEVLLYGEIVPDNWRWMESDMSAYAFEKQIREMRSAGADKLHLRINCPGGAVDEAVAMRSDIINAGFEEMTATIEGLCASAATVPITVPGMRVRIAPGSEFMIHNPAGGIYGDAAEMEKGAMRLRKLEGSVAKLYAERTGRDVDEIRDWMNAETWLTPEEAVEYGFADEVLADKKDDGTAKMSAQTMQVMMSAYRSIPERLYALVTEGHQQRPEQTNGLLGAGLDREGGETAMRMNVCAEDEIGPGAADADNAASADDIAAAAQGERSGQYEEENNDMDMTQMTAEHLRAGNPELYAAMMRDAAEAERARMQEIDDLTEPGYEQMAADAKKNGTSPMEFMKMLVAAKKQKRENYRAMRAEETKPADEVTGGDSGDNDEEQQYADEMAKYQAEMKAIGAQMRVGSNGSMF